MTLFFYVFDRTLISGIISNIQKGEVYMNVIEILNNELKGKNWTTDEKAFYIYLRSCQLFSYDPRFQFCDLIQNGDRLKYDIYNRTIDLENVKDNLVVCTTHTREVLIELLRRLLTIDTKYHGKDHAWASFYDSKRLIRADSTISGDITRVKMGLKPNGYKTTTRDYNFSSYLKEMAKKVEYIEDEYTGYFIEQKQKKFKDKSIIDRLYGIKYIFKEFNFTNFSEASNCISYLCHKVLGSDNYKMHTIPLFQYDGDDSWTFYNIYSIKLEQETFYFILEKVGEEFYFYEVSAQDAIYHVNNLNGRSKKLLHIPSSI